LVTDFNVVQINTVPLTSQTDIGEAIDLAQALFPADSAKRIVLLTDGRNNQGSMDYAIRIAKTNGVDIILVPLESNVEDDAAILDLQLPTRIPQDKSFDLTFTVYSSVNQSAIVRVLSSGGVVSEQNIQLGEGEQSYSIPLTTERIGVNEFEIQLIAARDSVPQNNRLSGITYVTGPPKVLVVSVPSGSIYPNGESRPDEAGPLLNLLESGNYQFDVTLPEDLPLDPAYLAQYNAVIMIDVPGQSLSLIQMRTLQTYVRDLGGGLVTIGGLTSYGVGGYYNTPLEEMLPLRMQNQDEVRQSTLTLVFVIDRSNSMTDTSGGISKLELAKEAVLRSIELLMPTDKVGVVIFDSSPRWVTPITEVSNKEVILSSVASIRSGGGTNILAGLQAVAQQLPADDGQVKHVILLTDGGANPSGIPELVQRMNQAYKITLTSVGVGTDAAPFLPDLALLGGGRFHHVTDPQTIPNIFMEETTLATRSYVVEQTFLPQIKTNSPILYGIDSLPILHGYVTSSPKAAGTIILSSELGDPILANWQYGLGRTVAFTSDASGRWARSWLTWEGFSSFWNQIIGYASSPVDPSNIELVIQSNNGYSDLSVAAYDQAGASINSMEMLASIVRQDGQTQKVTLDQMGAGRYEARIDALAPGSYTINLSGNNQDDAERISETFGWAQSYSPEYVPVINQTEKSLQFSFSLPTLENPAQIFEHNLKTSNLIQPIWQQLLAFATILLVLDIAVRRLRVTTQDIHKSWEWTLNTLFPRRMSPQTRLVSVSQVSSLLELKQQRQKTQGFTIRNKEQSSNVPTQSKHENTEVQPHSKEGSSIQRSTASILLSRKRERAKGYLQEHKQ